MKILITGGTGLVGQNLGIELVRRGHELVVITRDKKSAELHLAYPAQIIECNLNRGPITSERLQGIQAVVHLAGENVAGGRWTSERKKTIFESRVLSLRNLISSFSKPQMEQLKTFVSTSAIGYYGDTGTQTATEESLPGNDFLSEVCQAWEAPLQELPVQIRKTILRVGVVLSQVGGALAKMEEPFRLGLGGKVGSGQQSMSWIQIQDLVSLYVQALENEKWQGVYNAVAPEPVSNEEFSRQLAQVLRGTPRLGLPLPEFALSLAMGEMSSILTGSQRVASLRLSQMGFNFKFPQLNEALKECYPSDQIGYSIFRSQQYLPFSRDRVFSFFSSAKNLEKITPPFLNFKILNESTPTIEKGTLIDYSLKIHQVPVRWRTEISEWRPEESFTDSQQKGPYSEWIHTHSFSQLGSGTLMEDCVKYKLPMGSLGSLTAGFLVRKDIEEIFNYRRKVVSQLL